MLQMRTSALRSIAAALAAASALAACSHAPAGALRTTPQPSPDTQGQLSAVARARADSARRPYTEADIHFMSGMIGHHSQAILMAGWAPSHGASASVQQDEIHTMQQWLRDRGQPVPEAGAHMMMPMPGMLTDEQLEQLDAARGGDFDRLFLRDMIQHHRGAVSMVQALFGTRGAARDELVFKFANDVNVDQSTEIARMERMLAGLTSQ
jgi:uncharacterized protein (DUF305 family)